MVPPFPKGLGTTNDQKETHIVDDFMTEVRSHIAAVQTNPMWAQRVGDLDRAARSVRALAPSRSLAWPSWWSWAS
jgi:hypothetical protein